VGKRGCGLGGRVAAMAVSSLVGPGGGSSRRDVHSGPDARQREAGARATPIPAATMAGRLVVEGFERRSAVGSDDFAAAIKGFGDRVVSARVSQGSW